MRILITNDDGYDAPGLFALADAVRRLDDVEIDVIAPAQAQSGKGHTVSAEFQFDRKPVNGLGDITVVAGSPPDCVRAALILSDRPRPDWVIAGINRGSNIGIDIYYSGTIAAAREAAFFGIPAVAVSQLVRRDLPDDWPRSTGHAAAVLAALLFPDRPAPAGCDPRIHEMACQALRDRTVTKGNPLRPPLWSINLPRPPDDQPPTGVWVVPASTDPVNLDYEASTDEHGTQRLTYVGDYHRRPATEGTDIAITFAGGIAISPLPL